MDIKLLLQAFSQTWFIEEQAALEYAVIANKIRSGETFDFQSKSSTPYMSGNSSLANSGNALVIPICGPIMKYDYCGSLGTQSMVSIIEAANRNVNVQSIVLNIDSPGGAVNGTEDLANAVLNSKKPVVAFANGTMGSAAYWAGVNATEIIISGETCIVGSIGTMARLEKNKDAQTYQVLFATKSTRKNKANADNPEAFIKTFLDPLNNAFLSAVTTARAGKIDTAKEDVTEGDIYIGKKAIAVGLADKMGNLDFAIKRSLILAKTF